MWTHFWERMQNWLATNILSILCLERKVCLFWYINVQYNITKYRWVQWSAEILMFQGWVNYCGRKISDNCQKKKDPISPCFCGRGIWCLNNTLTRKIARVLWRLMNIFHLTFVFMFSEILWSLTMLIFFSCKEPVEPLTLEEVADRCHASEDVLPFISLISFFPWKLICYWFIFAFTFSLTVFSVPVVCRLKWSSR